MSFFKRKTEEAPLTRRTPEEDGGTVRAYDPHGGLTPVDYRMSDSLLELEATFERQVLRFLQNADPDQFNGSFFDGVILAVQNDCLAELERQRIIHENTIEKLIGGIWAGDKVRNAHRRQNAEREFWELERELRFLTRLSHRDTAMEEFEDEPYPTEEEKKELLPCAEGGI